MSKTSLQGGRAEEHELLCNGTIMNRVPEKRSGGLGVITYKYYNSRRRSGGRGVVWNLVRTVRAPIGHFLRLPIAGHRVGPLPVVARSFPLPALFNFQIS